MNKVIKMKHYARIKKGKFNIIILQRRTQNEYSSCYCSVKVKNVSI